jgi:two-component system nitrogen regulation response regulator NtrX
MERPFALVADPDSRVRTAVCGALVLRQRVALEVARPADIAPLLREHAVELLIADVAWGGDASREGIDGAQVPVLVALAGPTDRALELIQAGAFDVLRKPLEPVVLEEVMERALRQCAWVRDWRRTRSRLRSHEGARAIVGHSPGIERLRERLLHLAAVPRDVWISGEPGTGRELAARTLHELSPAVGGEFAVVRGAALDSASWEAQRRGTGRAGTLYVEDFTAILPGIQAQMLQTLRPAGSAAPSELRLIFSSTREPEQAIDAGELAPELWRTLGCETMLLPPLRERRGDVALLARHFVATICQLNQLPEISLTPQADALLESYPWPENVRELRNAIEQAVILSSGGRVRPEDLPERIRQPSGSVALTQPSVLAGRAFRAAKRDVVARFEREYLAELMRRHAGNVTSAAQQAGMLRSALQRLLRKCGMKSVDFRERSASARNDVRARAD